MAAAKRIFVAVVAAICLAGVLAGKAPRDAPAAAETGQLQEVVNRAKDTLANVSTQVTHLLGLESVPDREEIVGVLTNQSQVLGAKIEQFIGKLNKDAQSASTDFGALLTSISARLNETVHNLQPSPGVTKQASEIQEQITAGLNTVLEEAGKLSRAIGGEASAVQEDLDKLTRTAVEQAVIIGKQVEASVKTVIADHQTPQA